MDEHDRGDEHPPPYVGAYDASSSSDSEDEVIEDEERRSRDYDGGRRGHMRGGRHYESIRLQRAPGGTLQQADSCMVGRMDPRGCAIM